MSRPDLDALARAVVVRARPGEQVEAYAVEEVRTCVEALDGQVDALSSAAIRGLGVRVVAGGRQGHAWTTVLSDRGLDEAVAHARDNAGATAPDDARGLPDPVPQPDLPGMAAPTLHAVPVERKIELALALEASARSADRRVRGVRVARYTDRRRHTALASTTGADLTARRTDAWVQVRALAGDVAETATGVGVGLARGPEGLDVVAIGRDAAARAVRLLGGGRPHSGNHAVVLDPLVTASLVGFVGRALGAHAALRNRSVLAQRVGDVVASPQVTLVDDGVLADGPRAAPWDGEGVPQRTTTVIEDGRLRTLLHDTWTGRRYGVASTGNAARAGLRAAPAHAPTNLFLQPGTAPPGDVVAGVGDGLYVQEVMGLHSGASPVTGDLSVSVVGLRIRDGELAEPVRQAVVSTTLEDLLAGIAVVGSDRRFTSPHGPGAATTVAVDRMTVSGR